MVFRCRYSKQGDHSNTFISCYSLRIRFHERTSSHYHTGRGPLL